MNSLMSIQSQIEKLQKQANEIKAREFNKAVQEVLATMDAFGITVNDLRSDKTRVSKTSDASFAEKKTPAKRKNNQARTVSAKYRGPNEETWSGRGLTPRWLSALLAQGRTKEEFAIKS